MTFIKCFKLAAQVRIGALMLATLIVGVGCQSVPTTEDVQAGSESAVARQPNPYLENRPSVPSAAKKRFADASEALKQQQWDVAETDLLWLTENYPQFSGPFLNLALVYQRLGKNDSVDGAFQQAIAANANNVAAYNQYGIYLRGQGKFAEAETVYQQALAVWSDSADTHLNLGILYDLYMGQLSQALVHYQAFQALQDEPDRQVQGWIVDTQRRLSQQQARSGGES